jgi:hypothetical protein
MRWLRFHYRAVFMRLKGTWSITISQQAAQH